jgi:chemotaxis protein MotB
MLTRASSRVALALALTFCLPALACDSAELEEALATAKAEAEKAKADTEKAKADTEAKLAPLEAERSELQAKIEEQAAQIAALENAKGSLEGELEKKEAALEAIKALEDSLAKSLVQEIETGEIRVSQRDGYLVVDVSDKVLFATGEAELSERGQKVITKLADSLKALPKKSVFQVGGHTDNQPIKSEEVKAKFPTNWELSAARATNVVRFLEETCDVPGERLVAAAFSQFRPVASNKKPKNRSKNRRIEIALLPPRP